MKNNDLHGFNDVYNFTLIQTIKSNSFKSFTIILCLIMLVSMPVAELITNGFGKRENVSDISKLYIIDETGMEEVDFNGIKEDYDQYKNTTFEYTDKSLDEVEEELLSEDNGTVLLHISQEIDAYNMQFVRIPGGEVSEMEIYDLSGPINEVFQANLLKNLDVSPEQRDMLREPILIEVDTYTGEVSKGDTRLSLTLSEYYVLLTFIVFFIMMISYGANGIASTIVTEKSTKLIEILLTRIRPMAIVVGKVLAILTSTLGQVLLAGLSLGLSFVIYKFMFNAESYLPGFVTSALDSNVLENVTVTNVFIAIVIFVFGFLFYGFLAGLTGATVSKIEELQQGMILFSALQIIGAYTVLALSMTSIYSAPNQIFAYICLLLPISSIYVVPAYILMGKISISLALLSIVILIISTILLVKFTSKVYQTIILHQGNVIKPKDLISISKTSKEAR